MGLIYNFLQLKQIQKIISVVNTYNLIIISEMYSSSEEGYVIVPINKIILDRSIINTIKQYGGTVPKGIRFSRDVTAPLNRMEPLKDNTGIVLIPSPYYAIKEGKALPPIILRPFGKTGYYTIVEGRHRVASSVLKGYKYIPAILVN